VYQPVTHLTPHLWTGQSRLFHTNHGVFLSGRAACLVDPGIFPQEIAAITEFVADRGARVDTIILTHSHWDHILGPERFPGARVVAQAAYLAQVREGEGSILKSIAAWEHESGVERHEPFAIPLPTETFEETTTLAVDGLTLKLTHAPGHAADQLTVYHAESATLWAADMLSDLEIPFVSHDLEAYRRTLDALAHLEIRALVPGHGHTTTDPQEIHDRLAEDLAYLDELQMRVAEAVRQGSGLEETVALCENMAYRNRAENQGPHRWNVESAYVALGGDAGDAKVGWEKEE
jgi:glyoxylase-like metal-dependent hydrolase (beta-lactamase superfamily II)